MTVQSLPIRQTVAGSVDQSAWIVAGLISLSVCIAMLALSAAAWHWFLLPVFVCGTIIGRDAVDWFRGTLDVFHPIGMLGLFGLHFFLLAPLLHVFWDFWFDYRFPPNDWRPWIGQMAILNVLGLLIYRLVRQRVMLRWASAPFRKTWRLNGKRLWPLLIGALAVTGSLQASVYLGFGGLQEYMQVYGDHIGKGWMQNPFLGMGWMLTIAESFPSLFAIGVILLASRRESWRTAPALLLMVAVFIALELLFGGLRGSRNNVVFGLFWSVGLIHLYLKQLSRRHLLAGMALLFVFMNIYFFYKHGGTEGISALGDPTSRDLVLSRKRIGDEQKFILLRDFGRADIQALALYLMRSDDEYEYAWGRSYAAGAVSVIPRAVWPDRPATVVQERTRLMYGPRSPWAMSEWVAPWIFGLAGEAMLNFGPLSAPLSFAVWGLVVGIVASMWRRLEPHDSRRLMLPFLIGVCFMVLIGDSHVVVYFLVKDGLVPAGILFLASDRLRPGEETPSEVVA